MTRMSKTKRREETGRSADESSVAALPSASSEMPMTHERIRELIQAEVDRQNPLEETRRAAALIAESTIRFVEEPGTPGFVIIGPDGQPRMTVRDGRSVPFTLHDLAVELRHNYPALFEAEPSDITAPTLTPEDLPKSPPKRDWLRIGSREADAQIEPDASSEAAPSDSQGRWRNTLAELRLWTKRWTPKSGPTDRAKTSEANISSALDLLPVDRFRPSYAAYAGALLVLGAILALIVSRPGSETASSSASGQQATSGSVTAPAATGSIASPQPAAGGAPKPPGALAGVPEVVDTSTLRIDGKLVRLFGVEWARGGQAEDLTRYIAGRQVVCTPAARSDKHRCQIDGRDLSEVVLYNGGGRATAEATPELKAAEAQARAAGFGMWQKP